MVKDYIDPLVDISKVETLQFSLRSKSIGITDIILKCERKGRSSLDKHLVKKEFNHSFFDYPPIGKKVKFLCTSKGLMNDMLLSPSFFELHHTIRVNSALSFSKQSDFVSRLKGKNSLVINPIFKFLEIEGLGKIEILAIPSPGSPYRKLDNFGFYKGNRELFLKSYLAAAFKWFVE